jgi:hypothetical protein
MTAYGTQNEYTQGAWGNMNNAIARNLVGYFFVMLCVLPRDSVYCPTTQPAKQALPLPYTCNTLLFIQLMRKSLQIMRVVQQSTVALLHRKYSLGIVCRCKRRHSYVCAHSTFLA